MDNLVYHGCLGLCCQDHESEVVHRKAGAKKKMSLKEYQKQVIEEVFSDTVASEFPTDLSDKVKVIVVTYNMLFSDSDALMREYVRRAILRSIEV